MRNYWLRIALGAVAIFIVGMIGVTLARQGVGRVRHVVEGSGPISVPLAFIPFHLNGQKLGTVSRVVLLRERAQANLGSAARGHSAGFCGRARTGRLPADRQPR